MPEPEEHCNCVQLMNNHTKPLPRRQAILEGMGICGEPQAASACNSSQMFRHIRGMAYVNSYALASD